MSRVSARRRRGIPLAGREPLDDDRGDDDRPDRDVPARRVRPARHLGAVVVGPREAPARGEGLVHRGPDERQAGERQCRMLPRRPAARAGTVKSYRFVSEAPRRLEADAQDEPGVSSERDVTNRSRPSYEVTPAHAENVKPVAAAIRTHRPRFKGVDEVQDGKQTSKRILQVATWIWQVFLVAVVILLVTSTLLIGNTIRLSIFSRRREIEVMKLVGATNWFVRGPFVLEGLICGLSGSIAAIVLLLLGRVGWNASSISTSTSDVRAVSFSLMALILIGVGLARRRGRLRADACAASCACRRPRVSHVSGKRRPRPQGAACAASRAAPPGERIGAGGRPSRRARHRDPAARAPRRARIGGRAPRPDQLRQDPRCARLPEGAGTGRLRRPAADARPGGVPAALGRARRGAGRARHRRGARERDRADHLLHRRDGPVERRSARARRGAVGRRRRARLRVDAPAARRRVPPHPAAGRARRRAARPPCVSGRRGEGVRAEAAARMDRRGASCARCVRARCSSRSAARRCWRLPARSTGGIPGRVAVLYGAMPLASRREEIDRFISGAGGRLRRHRRARSRRQSALRDAALRGDDEVRRAGAPRSPPVGAGADRRPGGPVRPRRARARRRARRGGVGERRSGPRRVGARAARRAPRGPSRLPDRGRGPDPAAAGRPRCARIHGISTRRSPPGIASPRASGRTRAGSRSSRWRRSAGGSEPCRSGWWSAAAGFRSRTRGSSSTRPSTRITSSCLSTLALAVAGDTAQRSLLAFLIDPNRLRDATLEEAEQAGRVASILRWFALQYPGVGGVTIERAAALEEAAAARVVARLQVEVSDPTIGRCRSCGGTCAPWFPLCDRCFTRSR